MTAAAVEIVGVRKQFGQVTALERVDFEVRAGEFVSLLGASGCGKSTLLRIIAGFEAPSDGAVHIYGEDVTQQPPERRPTNLVFQRGALFPHMTVRENIAYGLKLKKWERSRINARVDEMLALVRLDQLGEREPSQLSGGQAQRVALARALAGEPRVLLLDEPLSALDLKLRQHMRAELRELQKRTGVTFIYITHDQGEALTMSDRIGVMSRGVLEQVGDGKTIYDHPETAFVASFVGESNRFAGPVVEAAEGWAVLDTAFGPLRGRNPRGLAVGERATLFVRPERLTPGGNGNGLSGNGPSGSGPSENGLSARVSHSDFEGAFVNAFLDGGLTVQMPHLGQEPVFVPGETVRLGFRATDAVVLPTG